MPSEKKLKIAFICPYQRDIAPGQRFRYEQYLDILSMLGHSWQLFPFLDKRTNDILYKKGMYFRKMLGVIRGFISRKLLLFSISKFDYVFIFREATPIGPPFFEWFIAKILRKKIIYDFDDAIWIPNTSRENILVSGLKYHRKVRSICRWSYKVSCGNQYLCDFASAYNKNVVLNPTTIDTKNLHHKTKVQAGDNPVIGWTGSHSTLRYLNTLIPALKKLESAYEFTFLVIADKDPELPLTSYRFARWNIDTELEDLLRINIGVMPLEEDPWSKGKCGFKALQYMALGIPALVSPVGVNTLIVDDGKNGFICRTEQDWYEKMEYLLKNEQARTQLGREAREKVIKHYSVESNTVNFLSLFEIH
ncbi:MAG: glycosyltransferase family 4 protein [Cytophagaceae bacterium]